jgi:hypothetical protein
MSRSNALRLPVAAAVVLVLAAVLAGSALSAGYALKPAITSFSPGTAKAMATVTVHGKNFSAVKTVKVDGKSVAFKVASTTKITITLPSTVKSGKIAVATAGGTATSVRRLVIKA